MQLPSLTAQDTKRKREKKIGFYTFLYLSHKNPCEIPEETGNGGAVPLDLGCATAVTPGRALSEGTGGNRKEGVAYTLQGLHSHIIFFNPWNNSVRILITILFSFYR